MSALLFSLLWLTAGEVPLLMTSHSTGRSPAAISLFTCVAAGDYYSIAISEDTAELIRAGADMRVFESRRGRLSPAEMQALQQAIDAADLPAHRVVLPFQYEPGLIVEDVYHFVGGQGRGGFVGHELSLPGDVKSLVRMLTQVCGRLPASPAVSSRVLALPDEMLGCLGADAPRIDRLSTTGAGGYLDRALRDLGRPILVPDRDVDALVTKVLRGHILARTTRQDAGYAVIVLRPVD